MSATFFTCTLDSPVSDRVLALLDYHFHYGACSRQNECEFVEQIADLAAVHTREDLRISTRH
jgi:hypothetical protein